jgi:hypothetical protein
VVDFSFRKKLFRSKAAASPRLEEEYELVGGAHGLDSLWINEELNEKFTELE